MKKTQQTFEKTSVPKKKLLKKTFEKASVPERKKFKFQV